MPLSRRSLLQAGVTAGVSALALPWTRDAAAQPVARALRTRYNVKTPKGKQMLAKYATAVGLMMDATKFPPSDPRSWTFQWYTHWVPGDISWPQAAVDKKNAIDKAFAGKPANDPGRLLAQAMWDDCQAHSTNPGDPNFFQEMYFCVWHRFYVYYFEQIIRAVLNDASFTLPYWNYLSGQVSDLSLPPEFRDTASPLFRPNRNAWVNAGERIDKFNPGVLNLDALDETLYIDSPDGGQGFCPILDGNPHGLVHVLIGGPQNMGAVPTAAGDPIFWVHHCNIDRLWESWNRIPNRTNPVWPSRVFPFADGQGAAVSALPAKANRTALLQYKYDRYATAPAGSVGPSAPPTLTASPQAASRVTRAFAPEPVTLGARTSVSLTPPASAAVLGTAGPGPMRVGSGRRLYLVLGGLSAPADATATYNVFLGLPDGAADPGPGDPHYVGTLHFFGAAGHGAHAPSSHRISFNLTKKMDALSAAGALSATPNVTLVRRGDPESTPPTVAQVFLVEG
jgi:tyrosinase